MLTISDKNFLSRVPWKNNCHFVKNSSVEVSASRHSSLSLNIADLSGSNTLYQNE